MSEPFDFPNDSEDERGANEEEENTLAARDTWFGLANSTTHHLKVETFNEYVREKQSGGKSAEASVGVEGVPASLQLQAKKEKIDLEMGERLPNGTMQDINPEIYEKIRVPTDNILKSKLVDIKIFKVENSEPKLFFTTRIKVKHGLIVIKDESCPEGLKVIPAKGQFWEFNRWKPHKNWKAANKKKTYDPILMMFEA